MDKVDYEKYENNQFLIEMKNVQQNSREPFRRIFFAKKYQVLFWYESNEIVGMQIEYGGDSFPDVITIGTNNKIIKSYTKAQNSVFPQSEVLGNLGEVKLNLIWHYIKDTIDQLPKAEREYIRERL